MRLLALLAFPLALTLSGACGGKQSPDAPPLPAEARLVGDGQGGWALDTGGADPLPAGTYLQIHAPEPLPGSQIRPVIGLAQARAAKGARPQPLSLLYHIPEATLSSGGMNPVTSLSHPEDARVGASFGRVLTQSPEGAILNVGSLDGVAPGSTYTLVSLGAGGALTDLPGRCTVAAQAIETTFSQCAPADAALPEGELFARLESDLTLTSASSRAPCAYTPEGDGALATLGPKGACALLTQAYMEFVERFGPGGSGGELGVYLDQRYLDPDSGQGEATPTPAAAAPAEAGWSPPPASARMDTRVRAFLDDPAQRLLLIMGPMGAGKTTFSRRFSYDLAMEAMETGSGIIPLRVSLSDTVAPEEDLYAMDGATLIARVLTQLTGQDITPEAARADVVAGRLLPLFDGFDEVAMRGVTTDAAAYFRALGAEFASPESKVMVLSRSSEIRGEGLLGLTLALEQAVYELEGQSLLFLIPFSQDVVERYLERLVADPADRARTLERLNSYFDLATLSRTPLLVYIVAQYLTNGDSQREMPTDIYGLYRQYTADWAEASLTKRGLSQGEAEQFMRRAMAMGLALDQARAEIISEEELSSFIAAYPWTEAPVEANHAWTEGIQEARGGAFLKPTRKGGYRFIDPSFAHFFTAEGLLQQMRYVWLEDAPEWGHKPFLAALGNMKPSPDALTFLRDGMGPDPLADRAVQTFIAAAEGDYRLQTLYTLRLDRQRLINPMGDPGVDAIARESRFAYDDLYREEDAALKAESRAGAEALAAKGDRYRLLAGDTGILEDVKDGSQWVFIPGGPLLTGSVAVAGSDLTRREVAEPFLLGRYPVTNGEYRPFEEQGNHAPAPSPTFDSAIPYLGLWTRTRKGLRFPEERADLPVVGVSQEDARAYANWLTRLDASVPMRLPNAEEWELAARGRLGRRYPWGDGWDARMIPGIEEGPSPRGADIAEGPFGAAQMAGGVWEWVLPGAATSMDAQGTTKGGAFTASPAQQATHVQMDPPAKDMRRADLGFRLRRPAE